MRVLKLIIKKYPLVVMVPLAAGIIFVGASAAHTVYQSLSYTPPGISGEKKATDNTAKPRPTLDNYAIISQRNLFASAASSLEERAATAGKGTLSAASVPFKLKGTVVVTSGVSFAIVEDAATKKEELFHENDVVQGFRILKISRNKMIVDRNGYEEVVEVLDEQEKAPASTGAPLQRPRTLIRGPVRTPMPVPITPPPEEAP